MDKMQQLMEHLKRIERGKETNTHIIKQYQRKIDGKDATKIKNVFDEIDPNEIYTTLQTGQRKQPKKKSHVDPIEQQVHRKSALILPLDTRRDILHADMNQLLQPPPIIAIPIPAPSSPKKELHLDGKVDRKLLDQSQIQRVEVREATDEVEKILSKAQDLIPLSFFVERDMTDLCQSKAGSTIKAAFQTFILHFYADAWKHWQIFIDGHRLAERVAAALFIQRVFRGFRARKSCTLLRLRLKELQDAKTNLIQQIVLRRQECALFIQMAFRRLKLQRRHKDTLARHAAAKKIQRLTIFNKQRALALAKMLLDARQIHAAQTIQRIYRGYRGRKLTKVRRTQVRHAKYFRMLSNPVTAIAYRFETQGAAFRIQRQVRRWITRRRGRELRANIRLERAKAKLHRLMLRYVICFKKRVLERQVTENHAKRVKAARTIQRYILQWIQRRKWKLLRIARRKQGRLERQKLKASRIKQTISLPHVKPNFLSYHAASKMWRNLSLKLRKPKGNRKEDAAICIQRAWRCAKKRYQCYLKSLYTKLDYAADKRKILHHAVTRIQKIWRGRRDRKGYRILWLNKVTRKAIQKWKLRRARRRDAAATKIQTKFRVIRAKEITRTVQHILKIQNQAATRIQAYTRRHQSIIKVQRQRDLTRFNEETLLFCRGSFEKCYKQNMDMLVIQSLEGTMNDIMKYPKWIENPIFLKKDISFPIFQILFCDYSGVKRETWKKYTSKELNGLRLDRIKFVKIFREAFSTSDRMMEITSDADRVLAKQKSIPTQSRSSLTYFDFIYCLKEMAILQIKTKKKISNDEKIIQLFWNYIGTSKWSKKYNGPNELKQYTLTWMNAQATTIQYAAKRQEYRQRGYILMDLQRQEWKQMKLHQAANRIQNAWKRKLSRKYLQKLMQQVFRKYIDAQTGLPYWINPKTNYSTWKKPRLLGNTDVDHTPIPMADEMIEYVVQCCNCNIHSIQEICFQCDEFFCKNCYNSLHSKGKWISHDHYPVATCISCSYQIATRTCLECKENYCDNCMIYLHSKGTLQYHRSTPFVELCLDCGEKRAVRIHCHTCNKDLCKSCAQYHPPEYCRSEPLPFKSIPVEKERLRLDTIKTDEIKAQEKQIQDAKDYEIHRLKCVLRIQRGWRRKLHCKSGIMELFDMHKQQQALWGKIQRDHQIENKIMYRVKGLFGKAQELEMDTPTQRILRRLNVYTRYSIQTRSKALNVSLEEYIHLGVLLPGVASIEEGSDQLETSEDLRGWLKPAQAIRIQNFVVYAQTVESIGETFIRLSAPFPHPSIHKSQFYSVEFSIDHPVRLKHAADKREIKIRELKESKVATNSLRKFGTIAQSLAHRFDEDSFLGRTLTKTAHTVQQRLQRQQFNQSKREREAQVLSIHRSEQDRKRFSSRREQSQRHIDRHLDVETKQEDKTSNNPAVQSQVTTTSTHVVSKPIQETSLPNTAGASPQLLQTKSETTPTAPEANVIQPPVHRSRPPSTLTYTPIQAQPAPSQTDQVSEPPSSVSIIPPEPTLGLSGDVPADTAIEYQVESTEDIAARSYDMYGIEDSSYNVAMPDYQQYTPTDNEHVVANPTESTYTYDELQQGGYSTGVPATAVDEYTYHEDYTSGGAQESSYYDPKWNYQDYNQETTWGYDGYNQEPYTQEVEQTSSQDYYNQTTTSYDISQNEEAYPTTTDYTNQSYEQPTEWQEAYDPSSGRMYYYNSSTGESVWQ